MSPYSNSLLVLNDKAIEENLICEKNGHLSSSLPSQGEAVRVGERTSKYKKDLKPFIRPNVNSNLNKDNAIRERFYYKLGIRRCQSQREETGTAKHHHRSILSKSTKNRKHDRVHFNDKITIVPVPSYSRYSDRMRNRLWPSMQESHENIIRNSLEFASEGSNWRTAVEESSMVNNIHPIHTHIAHTYLKPKGIFLLYSKMAADSSLF